MRAAVAAGLGLFLLISEQLPAPPPPAFPRYLLRKKLDRRLGVIQRRLEESHHRFRQLERQQMGWK